MFPKTDMVVITGGSSCCILGHFALTAWDAFQNSCQHKALWNLPGPLCPSNTLGSFYSFLLTEWVCPWRNRGCICILILIHGSGLSNRQASQSFYAQLITVKSQKDTEWSLCSPNHGTEKSIWTELGAGLTETRYKRPWLQLVADLILQPLCFLSRP